MGNLKTPDSVGIDGGPGSGKTTGLLQICDNLMERGIIPCVVPEAATMLIDKGITPVSVGMEEFQKRIVLLQCENEKYWQDRAKHQAVMTGKQVILLHDRTLLTGSAYLPLKKGENQLEVFQKKILDSMDGNLNIESIRDRYKGIIHLVTAANGAEKYYTRANNKARTESPAQARARDLRTQHASLGHGHLAVVANRDKNGQPITFEQKMRNAVAEVYRIMGYPVPIELEDKYKIRNFNPANLPVKYEAVNITQTYLIPKDEGTEERIRMRSWMNYFSHVRTLKSPGPGDGRLEREHSILASHYVRLMKRKLPGTFTIRKIRYCFLWKHQYFEVDVFQGRLLGRVYMEREKTDQNDQTDLPPFIDVEENVTGQKKHGNFALAHE